jgi:predicted metal-dependent peptidase
MTAKIKDGYSWQRPNRRFVGVGTYLPGVNYVPKMGEVVIAVDTSGSIGGPEINMFNAQINRVLETCNPSKVHVVYCDSSVAGVEEFEPDDFPVRIDAKGGGGTAFKPVFDWVDNNIDECECVIYLTDGYGDQNTFTTHHDTVWLTTHSTDFDWGTVIKFEE